MERGNFNLNLKLDLNFKKFKVNSLAIVRQLCPITIGVIVIVLGFFMYFLYKNVYQTLAQAETVTSLKKEVSKESLNKDQFYQALEKIKKKTEAPSVNLSELKNPFAPLGTQSTIISTSTKK